MNSDQARRFIIIYSLAITGILATVLIVSPVIGIPITFPKNIQILQIVMPVFLGYLGAATHYIFMMPPPPVPVNHPFLSTLVKGPIIIFTIMVVASFAAFIYSNRDGANLGSNMSIDNLSMVISISLGILSATTGVIVARLFVLDQKSLMGSSKGKNKANLPSSKSGI